MARFGLIACTVLALMAGADRVSVRAEPRAFCKKVFNDDTPHPLPSSLVSAAKRRLGLHASRRVVMTTTVYRCMRAKILVCASGANLACYKADARRELPAAGRYCAAHPGSPFIPMVVTGHSTIYPWRCSGTAAEVGSPARLLDERGFLSSLWKAIDQ